MGESVIGMVQTRSDAETVVAALRGAGFSSDLISVLSPHHEEGPTAAESYRSKASEGALVGASAGGVGGGALGVLLGAGLVAIAGAGPLMAAGPILGALGGFAAGATVGSVAGALVAMGIPEIDAKRYEGRVHGGHILISVRAHSRHEMERAVQVLTAAGADDVSSTRSADASRD